MFLFDANWHQVYIDSSIRKEAVWREEECIQKYGANFSGDKTRREYDKVQEDAGILGDMIRPDYDIGLLRGLGYREISYIRNITKNLWDEKEKLMYGATPMFMIRAVKE